MMSPTHGRLLIKLAAIGPYLREKQCTKRHYFFDSLVVCVDAKKEPEDREFWGWWLVLESDQEASPTFTAQYGVGRYDLQGNWLADPVPSKVLEEVEGNLANFEGLLADAMDKNFSITLDKATQAEENKLPEFA